MTHPTTPEAAALAEECKREAAAIRGDFESTARLESLIDRLAALAQQPAKEAPAELPIAPECTPCAEHPGDLCRGTAECWACPLNEASHQPEQPRAAQASSAQSERELAAEAEVDAEEGPLLVAARKLIAGSKPIRECGSGYVVPAELWLALQEEAMHQLRTLASNYFSPAAAPAPQAEQADVQPLSETYDCPIDGVPKRERRKRARGPQNEAVEHLFNGFHNLIENLKERDPYLWGYTKAMRQAFADLLSTHSAEKAAPDAPVGDGGEA